MNRSDRMQLFCQEILSWYSRYKRILPWRDVKTNNLDHKAYLVLVSEVMLQQTQVPRVIEKYKKFIQEFPHIEDLAKATNAQVLRSWKGLGYNSRALRLRDAARAIHAAGRFPRTLASLRALPGVGPYTAAAVLNFAFEDPTPCIDTNIRRILLRYFPARRLPNASQADGDRRLHRLAGELLTIALHRCPGHSAADWHAALMDFGSMALPASRTKKVYKSEPGIHLAGQFVPRRILRGRIVELLRGSARGYSLSAITKHIGVSRDEKANVCWIRDLLDVLKREGIVRRHEGLYTL